MDIERLNKSQIVLLTLLVSFVTSIATGIVTVSLMDQAPPVIPQTINRIVERTVERVVPQETQTATVITKERTVTVKESDLIAQAVARAKGSVVRIHYGSETVGAFASRGVVVAKGYVVSDGRDMAIGNTFRIPVGDDTSIPAKVVALNGGAGLALLEIGESDIPAASFGTSEVVLGQGVVALTGSSAVKVANGIVAGVSDGPNATFEINLVPETLVRGAVITNTDGAVIGLYTGDARRIVPASVLIALMKALSAPEPATATSTETAS